MVIASAGRCRIFPLLISTLLVTACPQGSAPKPDELDDSRASLPTYGSRVPDAAIRLSVSGTVVSWNGMSYDTEDANWRSRFPTSKEMLIAPVADTYLAQVGRLLAHLDEQGASTWLLHPGGERAFAVKLRDQKAFGQWLDEAKPGRIRIIQREDGLELQTSVGKLAGSDSRGPTLPVRGGKLDLLALRRGLEQLKWRFKNGDEVCVVPSFGTELGKIAQVFSGCFESDNRPYFQRLCWVYPRNETR